MNLKHLLQPRRSTCSSHLRAQGCIPYAVVAQDSTPSPTARSSSISSSDETKKCASVRRSPIALRRERIIARFEIGEVLLTTFMGQVLAQIFRSIVSGDIACGKFLTKSEPAQARQLGRFAAGEEASSIECTSQFNLSPTLFFRLRESYGSDDLVRNFQHERHATKLIAPQMIGKGLSPRPCLMVACLVRLSRGGTLSSNCCLRCDALP